MPGLTKISKAKILHCEPPRMVKLTIIGVNHLEIPLKLIESILEDIMLTLPHQKLCFCLFMPPELDFSKIADEISDFKKYCVKTAGQKQKSSKPMEK
jgi:hypothetical protein